MICRHSCFSDIRSRVFQTHLTGNILSSKKTNGEVPVSSAISFNFMVGQAKKDGSHGYIDKGDLLLLWKSKAPTVDGHLEMGSIMRKSYGGLIQKHEVGVRIMRKHLQSHI